MQPLEEDFFYEADLEHDYSISTDDDSEHAKSKRHQIKSDKISVAGKHRKSKKATVLHNLCCWAGTVSAATFALSSYVLILLDTSVGNKIASLSWTQQVLLMMIVIVVARNIFIPSRLNRFENGEQLQQSSQKHSQKVKKSNRKNKDK